MPCSVTKDGQVTVKSSDKMWSTRGGNGKPLQYCLKKPMNSMKRQKDMIPEDESPRVVDVQYATEEEWKNSFKKNGEGGPMQKCHSVVAYVWW